MVSCSSWFITGLSFISCILSRILKIRSLAVAVFSLVLLFSFVTHSLAVSSTTPIVTLGDGVDATSSIVGPGTSATNTDSFTLRTSTTTATVNNVLINLAAGSKNDGVSWATSSSAADNAWNSVTYGNGLFVAVSYTGTGNRVMTSPDGITWTSRTSAADNSWNSIT